MALRLLLIVYLLEAGLFFMIAPWTRFWEMSPFLHQVAMIDLAASSSFVRGIVSGFGLLHFLFAGREILFLLAGREQSGRPANRIS